MASLQYERDEVLKLVSTFSNISYLASGSFSLAFSATKGNERFVIKLAKLGNTPKEKRQSEKELLREGYLGTFLTPSALPSSHQHWIQILAFGKADSEDPRFQVFRKAALGVENDLDRKSERSLLITRFAGETTMAQWLAAKKGPVGDREAKLIAFQIFWALNAANARYGLVHCDLKPENIMVNTIPQAQSFDYIIEGGDRFSIDYRDGDPFIVIIDLGGAYVNLNPPRTKSYPFVSEDLYKYPEIWTPSFSAPERILSNKHVASTDMFSVGVILCVLFMNKHPTFKLTNNAVNKYSYDSRPPVPLKENDLEDTKQFRLFYLLVLLYGMRVNTLRGEEWTAFLNSSYVTKSLSKNYNYNKLYEMMLAERGEYAVMFVQDLLRFDYESREQFGMEQRGKGNDDFFFAYAHNNALFHPFFTAGRERIYAKTSVARPGVMKFQLEEHAKSSEHLSDADRDALLSRIASAGSGFNQRVKYEGTVTEVSENKKKLEDALRALLNTLKLEKTEDVPVKIFQECYDLIFQVGLPKEFRGISDFTNPDAQAVKVGDVYFGSQTYKARTQKHVMVVLILTELGLVALDKRDALPKFKDDLVFSKALRDLRGGGRKQNPLTATFATRFQNYGEKGGNYAIALAEYKLGLTSDLDARLLELSSSKAEIHENNFFVFSPTLSKIVAILEGIERNNNFKYDNGDYNSIAIEHELITPIKIAITNHNEKIQSDENLQQAFSKVAGEETCSTRYYHYLSVLASILDTLDREEKVDSFLLERCRSEFTEIN